MLTNRDAEWQARVQAAEARAKEEEDAKNKIWRDYQAANAVAEARWDEMQKLLAEVERQRAQVAQLQGALTSIASICNNIALNMELVQPFDAWYVDIAKSRLRMVSEEIGLLLSRAQEAGTGADPITILKQERATFRALYRQSEERLNSEKAEWAKVLAETTKLLIAESSRAAATRDERNALNDEVVELRSAKRRLTEALRATIAADEDDHPMALSNAIEHLRALLNEEAQE